MANAKTPNGGDNEGVEKVEKQLEAETGKDFVKTGDNPPTLAETDKPGEPSGPDWDVAIHGQPVVAHIVNEKDGTISVHYSRPGYAPTPVPSGWRFATDDEIAKTKKP